LEFSEGYHGSNWSLKQNCVEFCHMSILFDGYKTGTFLLMEFGRGPYISLSFSLYWRSFSFSHFIIRKWRMVVVWSLSNYVEMELQYRISFVLMTSSDLGKPSLPKWTPKSDSLIFLCCVWGTSIRKTKLFVSPNASAQCFLFFLVI